MNLGTEKRSIYGRRGVSIIFIVILILAPFYTMSMGKAQTPKITIAIPGAHKIENYTYIHGTVTVEINVSGQFTEGTFYLDNEQIASFNISHYTYIWNTIYTGEGPHILMVIIYYNGTELNVTKTYYVDNHSPHINLTISPIINNKFLKGTVKIHVQVKDPLFSIASGIQLLSLFIDEKEVNSTTYSKLLTSCSVNYTWDTRLYRDGTHFIKILVKDNAGNAVNLTKTVEIDNHPPALAILSNVYLKGTVDINVSVSDNVSGIEKIVFYVDKKLAYTTYTSPYTFLWNTLNYSDGKHVLNVKVYDRAQNVNSASMVVFIDNTPPSITLLSPRENKINGTVTISITASDNVSGVEYIQLYIDGYLVKMVRSNNLTYIWNSTSYKNGVHNITVISSDCVGNVALKSFKFYILNSQNLTSLFIVSPSANTTLAFREVHVLWSVNGSVERYEIRVDNGTWINVGKNNSYTLLLSDGMHRITVLAISQSGTKIEKSVTVMIDTEPPNIEGLYSFYHLGSPGTITFRVTDLSSFTVTVYKLVNGQWTLYKRGSQSLWSINITNPGTYKFRIYARDSVGNSVEKLVTVEYVLLSSKHSKALGEYYLIVPILAVLLSVLLIFVIKTPKKKKQKKRELEPKERVILDQILSYVTEKEGASRYDVVKTVSNRMGISEDEVGIILQFAKENFLVSEKTDEDGVPRIYSLEKKEVSE